MFTIGRRKGPAKRLPDAALQKLKRDSQSRKNALARVRKSVRRDDRSTETAKPAPSAAGDKAAKADAPFGSQGVRRPAATVAGKTIPAPGPDERVEADIQPGQTLRLELPRLDNARFAVQGDALLIVLPNGGEILLANFVAAAAADLLTALCLADGTVVPAANLIVLAGTSLAEVAPAAGLAEEVAPAAGHAEHVPPTDPPPAARTEKVMRRPHPLLPREKGKMDKEITNKANTNEIKCYLSLDEMTKIIAEEIARRLEPERLLGDYTKKTAVFDDGRVEVTFSASNLAHVSTGD